MSIARENVTYEGRDFMEQARGLTGAVYGRRRVAGNTAELTWGDVFFGSHAAVNSSRHSDPLTILHQLFRISPR